MDYQVPHLAWHNPLPNFTDMPTPHQLAVLPIFPIIPILYVRMRGSAAYRFVEDVRIVGSITTHMRGVRQ